MDKHNKILRRSSVGIGLLLGVGGMLLAGCNRGSEETITATPAQSPVTPGPKRGGPGMPPGGPGARMGGPRAGMGGPVMGGPGMKAPGKGPAGKHPDPFAPGASGPGAAKTPPVAVFPPKKGFDPFYPTWHQIPPPPDVFEEIQPLRVASADVETPPAEPVVVREVADRRVSGIMSGDGVFAIIEQNGDSEVVKPGGTTRDGYRVISINDDSVKLQKKEGNVIRTQVVQLSDIQTGGQGMSRPGGFPGAQGSSMGGFPGGRMGGFPGRPGPGRPGGGGFNGGNKGD